MCMGVNDEIGQQTRKDGLKRKQKSQTGPGLLFLVVHCESVKFLFVSERNGSGDERKEVDDKAC